MDMTTRIAVGVLSALFLIGYAVWRWKRAGAYVEAQEAYRAAAREHFERLRRDPRWLALQAEIEQRYPITFDYTNASPEAFAVHQIGLVCDQGFTYRIDNPAGPQRIAALLVRQQPPTQIFMSRDLVTGELREDPAPHGWTFVGPPR